jgi:hypothetical protein
MVAFKISLTCIALIPMVFSLKCSAKRGNLTSYVAVLDGLIDMLFSVAIGSFIAGVWAF